MPCDNLGDFLERVEQPRCRLAMDDCDMADGAIAILAQ